MSNNVPSNPAYPMSGYPTPQQGPGGYPMPEQGAGGYPMPQQGAGGYPMPQQGAGGYPMPQQGAGGYPMPQQGAGGYPMPQQGEGGYPMPQQGAGGYPMPQQGEGGYPMPQQGEGGYPMPQQGAGGYPMPQQGAGGYPMPQQGAGGYPMPQQGAGGYPMPQQGAGGYPMPQQGAGGHPMPQQGAGGYPMPQQGAGGHPMPQQGAGGYPVSMPQQPGAGLQGLSGLKGTSVASSQVELSIKCSNLIDRDSFSKSDPMAVVYLQVGNQWVEVGRTENVKNSLNPEFARKIKVDYFFEQSQKIQIGIYDIDNTSSTLKDDDFLGSMEWTLGQVVASSPFTKPLTKKNGSKMRSGTITIFAIELDSSGKSELLQMCFRAQKLENKDFMGKSDPFLEILKSTGGSWQMIHRTEVIKNNLNPTWKVFEINRQLMGGINTNETILIRCFDYDSDGDNDLIGEAKITLGELLEGQAKTWDLINLKKQQKKGKSYKNSGILILESCQVQKAYSFLDFIFGGTKINFVIAVDFTASNGDPRDPNSLHFINPNQPNDYISAITSIGEIIQDYDSDKMFPGLGFGAKIPPDYSQANHEFALNFNMTNPFCPGIAGLISAYQNCLSQIQLYGPTNFAPVINHCAKFASHAHSQSSPENYFVLLILTDGEITDLSETCNAIVNASQLPLSIIIVGVGNADFSKMSFLDGDGGPLKAPNGSRAVRDIVQFVPFNRYKNVDRAYLAKEVLAEVPQQMTMYFKQRNMAPKPVRENVQEFT